MVRQGLLHRDRQEGVGWVLDYSKRRWDGRMNQKKTKIYLSNGTVSRIAEDVVLNDGASSELFNLNSTVCRTSNAYYGYMCRAFSNHSFRNTR